MLGHVLSFVYYEIERDHHIRASFPRRRERDLSAKKGVQRRQLKSLDCFDFVYSGEASRSLAGSTGRHRNGYMVGKAFRRKHSVAFANH